MLLLWAAACAPAATFYITVTGLGGEPDYEQRFAGWAKEIDKSLRDAGGDARVETLVAPAREKVRATLAAVARDARAGGRPGRDADRPRHL